MQASAFRCPACNASLEMQEPGRPTVRCAYCNTTVIVPNGLRQDRNQFADEGLPEIGTLIDQGRKIEAIKRYREVSGAGLKQAKEAVEALERGEAVAMEPARRSASEGTAGCSLLLFVLVLLVAAGGVYLFLSPGANLGDISLPAGLPGSGPAVTVLAQGEGTGPGLFQDSRTLAVDSEGHLYIGDFQGGRIQRFAADGTPLGQWFTESGGPIGGLVTGPDGTFYVLEQGEINLYERASGRRLGPIAGELLPEEAAMIAGIRFDDITAGGDGGMVALGDGALLRFDRQGRLVLLNQELLAALPAGVNTASLRDMAVAGQNNLYLIFTFDDAVYHFDANGTYVDRFGRKGEGPGEFTAPTALAIDGRGRVLVEDFGRILIFDSDGIFREAFDVSGAAFALQVHGDRLYRLDRNGNRLVSYALER